MFAFPHFASLAKKTITAAAIFLVTMSFLSLASAAQVASEKPQIREMHSPNTQTFNTEKSKKTLLELLDRLEKLAQTGKTKIENLKKLTENSREILLENINEQLAVIAQIKVDVEKAQNKNDLQVVANRIHQTISDLKKAVKQSMSTRLQHRIEHFEKQGKTFATKAQKIIARLKGKNIDTSVVESDFQNFQNLMIQGDELEKKATIQSKEIQGLPKEDVTANLENINTQLQQSLEKFTEAQKLSAKIYTELKKR